MADKKNEAVADNTEKTAPSSKPKFTLERLRQDCLKIFGVTTSTFDGATCGKSGKFTLDEMKKIIEDWQNAPVKFNKKGVE